MARWNELWSKVARGSVWDQHTCVVKSAALSHTFSSLSLSLSPPSSLLPLPDHSPSRSPTHRRGSLCAVEPGSRNQGQVNSILSHAAHFALTQLRVMCFASDSLHQTAWPVGACTDRAFRVSPCLHHVCLSGEIFFKSDNFLNIGVHRTRPLKATQFISWQRSPIDKVVAYSLRRRGTSPQRTFLQRVSLSLGTRTIQGGRACPQGMAWAQTIPSDRRHQPGTAQTTSAWRRSGPWGTGRKTSCRGTSRTSPAGTW